MDTAIAIRTLDALANGTDPVTGQSFPEASPYNQPVVLRSLFLALKALQQPAQVNLTVPRPAATAAEAPAGSPAPAKKDKPSRQPPANAGKPWTSEEDQLLCSEFDSGIAVKELAVRHSRSTTALNARLFKLGKITDPGMPLRQPVRKPAGNHTAA